MGLKEFFKDKAPAPTTPNEEPSEEMTKQERLDFIKSLSGMLAGVVGGQYRTLNIGERDAYKSNDVVYSCVNILSDNIAELPLRVYRGDELMPEDFTFPGGFNIQHPHIRMSMNRLNKAASLYYFLRGEFMVYIDDDSPFSLEPINPKQMKIGDEDDFGNIVTWKHKNGMIIPYEKIIYEVMKDPDGKRGIPPAEVLKPELINDKSALGYSTKFFENFAQAGAVLYDTLGSISPEEMEVLVTGFNELATQQYKTKGLPYGIRMDNTTQTMREMEFSKSRKDIRDRVLSTFGLHKSEYGVTDQVDRAVAETAAKQKWTRTLRPAALKFQEAYNQALMRQYFPGYNVRFDFSGIAALQATLNDKTDVAQKYINLGFTTNEVNERFDLGMDQIDEERMNTRYVPTVLLPYERTTLENQSFMNIDNSGEKEEKILELLEEEEENKKVKKTLKSKLGRYNTEQLGKVLSIVKNTEEVNTTKILTKIFDLLQSEKELLIELVSSTGSDLELGSITNYTYKLLKQEIVKTDNIDTMCKGIQQVYKFNKSKMKEIVK